MHGSTRADADRDTTSRSVAVRAASPRSAAIAFDELEDADTGVGSSDVDREPRTAAADSHPLETGLSRVSPVRRREPTALARPAGRGAAGRRSGNRNSVWPATQSADSRLYGLRMS